MENKINYQLWPFCYIVGSNGVNIINGERSESDKEVDVKCFDGVGIIALPRQNGNIDYYKLTYPKINKVRNDAGIMNKIKRYCGYVPKDGEYGVVCGTFGLAKKITKTEFDYINQENS